MDSEPKMTGGPVGAVGSVPDKTGRTLLQVCSESVKVFGGSGHTHTHTH